MALPRLLIFGGLPGTGKTTLAAGLARSLPAQLLRIDTIEQTIQASILKQPDLEDAGYRIAYAVAAENLRLGHRVIADSVNSIALTREAWLQVAARAAVSALQIEVLCSDEAEHRRRIEARFAREGGPDWPAVESRTYEPWPDADLRVDTAGRSAEEALANLQRLLRDRDGRTIA